MKIKSLSLVLCVACLMILVTACRASKPAETNPGATNVPTETTAPTETTVPTETTAPTETTVPPTTAPVETTVPSTQPPVEMTDDQYAMTPDGYKIFVFDGESQPYPNSGPEFDLSTLTADCLYVYDKENNLLTQLCEKTIICYDTTYEHIYYLDIDGKQIIRSDYTGNQQEVMYTSDTEITWFDYYGTNAMGKLCVVEDYKKVVVLDLESGETETLMEQYYVEEAYYDADSLDYTSPDKGATILWHGKVTESDEFNTYLYYVQTGELEDPAWL